MRKLNLSFRTSDISSYLKFWQINSLPWQHLDFFLHKCPWFKPNVSCHQNGLTSSFLVLKFIASLV